MNPSLVLGMVMVATTVGLAPAQNLGLGTGSRSNPAEDSSAAIEGRQERQDEAPNPRKTQFNRRLGLAARKARVFDPKEFEARGRELQGQYYEIGTPANPKQQTGPNATVGTMALNPKSGSKQWVFWVGVAGAAGVSAGTVGYLLMNKAHPASAPPPKHLVLTDEP
ncbi:MAG: hypothetical protein JWP91_3161 [Fibrobacteres bacterium]|nr:hypothetical protein [Fibrobacterota bacterium]